MKDVITRIIMGKGGEPIKEVALRVHPDLLEERLWFAKVKRERKAAKLARIAVK
jgi:hypothetical protein